MHNWTHMTSDWLEVMLSTWLDLRNTFTRYSCFGNASDALVISYISYIFNTKYIDSLIYILLYLSLMYLHEIWSFCKKHYQKYFWYNSWMLNVLHRGRICFCNSRLFYFFFSMHICGENKDIAASHIKWCRTDTLKMPPAGKLLSCFNKLMIQFDVLSYSCLSTILFHYDQPHRHLAFFFIIFLATWVGKKAVSNM